MIAQLCIALFAVVGGKHDQEQGTVELYDLRWIEAQSMPGQYLPDAWRRGALHLDELIRDSSLLVKTYPITTDQLRDWASERHPHVIWRTPLEVFNGWQHAEAPTDSQTALKRDLAALRALLCEPVRVRWVELDAQLELAAGVIDRVTVQRVLASGNVRVMRDQRTTPGRSLVLRSRDSTAYIVDYDAESLSEPPALDPQVGVQRAGPEAVVMLQAEPDDAWDLRLVVQDADSLAARETHYPSGGELMQLPALRWTTLSTSARIPDGGGLVFESSSGEHNSRWMFTVERLEPRASDDSRFRNLGRLARTALVYVPDRVSTVSMSGGESSIPAWSWPFLDHWKAPYVAQDLDVASRLSQLHLADGADVPRALGPLIDLGESSDEGARRMLDELADDFPTYRVELRSVREPAIGRVFDNNHSAPNATIVSTAVRAGDVLAVSMLAERAYVMDADIEIGGSAMGPDPIHTGLSEGVTALVRCLPTRHNAIDVTCRVKDASINRASSSVRCVIRNSGSVNDYMAEIHGAPLPEMLNYEIELPQQSLSDVRAKLLAIPNEWQLVGSTLIADSKDQLTVWVRVAEIVP